MREAPLISFVGFVLIAISISPGFAGQNNNAKVAVHVMPHLESRTCSSDMPSLESPCWVHFVYVGCDAVDVFPVFYDIVEYRGFEYGLAWPGEATCIFTSCSDLSIGNITHSGDGISQVWLDCGGAGYPAVTGFAWIDGTEPGQICVVPHPIGGRVLVLDCHEGVNEPFYNLCAGVCGEPGDNPCWGNVWIDKTEDACGDCVGQSDTLSYTLIYQSDYFWSQDVSIIDYLAPETEYVSSTPPGTYDAGSHTVTWFIGEVSWWEYGEVVVRARLKPGAPASGTVVNRCKVFDDVIPLSVSSDSTSICSSATTPTTWGKIKSMFR